MMNRSMLLLLGVVAISAGVKTAWFAQGAVVDAVPGDHPQWSCVTGRTLSVSWDWSWAAASASSVKVTAYGTCLAAEAVIGKPMRELILELPASGETAFDLSLVFRDTAEQPVSPTRTVRLYAVERFQDAVRQPSPSGKWIFKNDALIPFDMVWTNAAAGVALTAQSAPSATNLSAVTRWGALPLRKKDFAGDGWHLTLSFANQSWLEADVAFVSAGLQVRVR